MMIDNIYEILTERRLGQCIICDCWYNCCAVKNIYTSKRDGLCPIQKLRVMVTQHRLWKFARLCSYG